MKRLEIANHEEMTPQKRQEVIEDTMRRFPGASREYVEHVLEDNKNDTVFLNDVYQVNARMMEKTYHGSHVVWLSIKRIDKQACHDWRDFQEIKNQVVGPECEAIELYPAESRLVDTANQYHLWVIADPTFRWPFGFWHSARDYSDSARHAKQREKGG